MPTRYHPIANSPVRNHDHVLKAGWSPSQSFASFGAPEAMENQEEKDQFRRYLLGDLPETQMEFIEENLIRDSAFRERLSVVEEELIEEYLDGELNATERAGFEHSFLATPQQRRRVRIVRLLHRQTPKPAPADFLATASVSTAAEKEKPKRFQWLNWRKPLVLIPTTAGVLIAVTFGVVKIQQVRREHQQREEAVRRHAELEDELAQLNSSKQTAGTVSKAQLAAGSIRTGAPVNRFALPHTDILELQLLLEGDIYPHYEVLLNRAGETETFRIGNLKPGSVSSQEMLAVRLPTKWLSQSAYRLQLIGVASNGMKQPARGYTFEITGPP